MTLMEWYAATVGDASVNAVATRADIVQTTLARQIKAQSLSPEVIVAVARAYGRDVLDALVLAGLISREDIRAHGVHRALSDAFDAEIAAEVVRRLASGEPRPILDTPLS